MGGEGPGEVGGTGGEEPGGVGGTGEGKLDGCIMHQVHTSSFEGSIKTWVLVEV
jgi:hypothetical protein